MRPNSIILANQFWILINHKLLCLSDNLDLFSFESIYIVFAFIFLDVKLGNKRGNENDY